MIDGQWSIIREADSSYYCHAWGVGMQSTKALHEEMERMGFFTKGRDRPTFKQWDAYLWTKGWKKSNNCKPEFKKRKLAVFTQKRPGQVNLRGNLTHTAIEEQDGDWWSSKLGNGPAI